MLLILVEQLWLVRRASWGPAGVPLVVEGDHGLEQKNQCHAEGNDDAEVIEMHQFPFVNA